MIKCKTPWCTSTLILKELKKQFIKIILLYKQLVLDV